MAICLEQAANSLMEIDTMVTCAEEGDEAVQGAVLHPVENHCADDIHLEFYGRWERCVIPDGVDDDVGDRIERAVAVASNEETAVEAGAQLTGRQPGDGLEVKPVDRVLKRPLEKLTFIVGCVKKRSHKKPYFSTNFFLHWPQKISFFFL